MQISELTESHKQTIEKIKQWDEAAYNTIYTAIFSSDPVICAKALECLNLYGEQQKVLMNSSIVEQVNVALQERINVSELMKIVETKEMRSMRVSDWDKFRLKWKW